MTFWQKLDSLPPVAIRLLAKNADGSAMTDETIRARAGIPLAAVKRLSYLPSWDDVRIYEARKFLLGCNCDLTDTRRVRVLNQYLRRDPKFTHLRKSPRFPEFREMLEVYAATLN